MLFQVIGLVNGRPLHNGALINKIPTTVEILLLPLNNNANIIV